MSKTHLTHLQQWQQTNKSRRNRATQASIAMIIAFACTAWLSFHGNILITSVVLIFALGIFFHWRKEWDALAAERRRALEKDGINTFSQTWNL